MKTRTPARPKLGSLEREQSGSTTVRISKATRELLGVLRSTVHAEDIKKHGYWTRRVSRYALRDDDLIYDSVFATLEAYDAAAALLEEQRSSTSAMATSAVDERRRPPAAKKSATSKPSTARRSPARRRQRSSGKRRAK